MTVFKVAYNPPFSDKMRSALRAYSPSMVCPDDDSAQFNIEVIDRAVTLYGVGRDKEILKELEDSKIGYVEIEYEDK